jgi:hypothetical protein
MRLFPMMLFSLAVLPVVPAAMAAEKTAPSGPASEAKPKVIELAIHPAKPPRPALKYSLLPGYLERTPGNAVPIYMKAAVFLGVNPGAERQDKIVKWLETPLESLPRDEVGKVLESHSAVINYVDIASRREQCDWDPPVREEGWNVFGILLPGAQSSRFAARLVALRARMQIAEKKYDEALASLRTGYGLARHVAEQPPVVCALVGLTLVETMNVQLQEMLTQPDAPNMYWAITTLPHPIIDLRRSFEFETAALYIMLPEMEPSKRRELSPTEWSAFAPKALWILAEFDERGADPPRTADEQREFVAKALKASPEAKADLIEAGHPKERVEAMEPAQAVLLDMFEIYEAHRDDMMKWLNTPYWQASQGMKEAKASLARSTKSPELTFLVDVLAPPAEVLYTAQVWREQRLAALRCVEAIRFYAATHGGKLPASLEDIQEVPVPTNPATGKIFSYRIENEVAVLDADGLLDEYRGQYRVSVVK